MDQLCKVGQKHDIHCFNARNIYPELIMIKQSENKPDDRNFSKAFFFLGNLKKVDFKKHRQETKLRNKQKKTKKTRKIL